MEYFSDSVEKTLEIAKEFAKSLSSKDVVLLDGDLGAGKTHFAKGVAVGLGVNEVVTSPTFALHNCYQGKLLLNHFDFYRIIDEQEVEILGLNELFYQENAVSLIEWWQNVSSLLPKKCKVVTIEKVSDTERRIIIEDKTL